MFQCGLMGDEIAFFAATEVTYLAMERFGIFRHFFVLYYRTGKTRENQRKKVCSGSFHSIASDGCINGEKRVRYQNCMFFRHFLKWTKINVQNQKNFLRLCEKKGGLLLIDVFIFEENQLSENHLKTIHSY
jgi:hypothetical protein